MASYDSDGRWSEPEAADGLRAWWIIGFAVFMVAMYLVGSGW